MQQLTKVNYSMSELKEATYARAARDVKDTQEVLLYLSQRSIFTAETSLKISQPDLRHHYLSMYMSLIIIIIITILLIIIYYICIAPYNTIL